MEVRIDERTPDRCAVARPRTERPVQEGGCRPDDLYTGSVSDPARDAAGALFLDAHRPIVGIQDRQLAAFQKADGMVFPPVAQTKDASSPVFVIDYDPTVQRVR
jgi:hypothetical protein